jgi:acyl-CoA reductase-like NAD-dependent aldehyde dehydrogenase
MIFGFSCASSLAGGNALIIKPSELGSLSILELCNYLDKIDLPKGLINVVTGKGQTLGRALAKSKVDLISFTGSLNTLKSIIQDSVDYPKKIICELGGCNLAVVFSDASFKKAIDNIFSSCFIKSGQMCIGTSLILIEEEIYQKFIAEFIKKTKDLKVGDPFLPQTNLGPLVSKRHLEEIDKKVKELIKKGAKLLVGGNPLKQKGYFYAPTVLELNEIIYEELFAPVVLVKSFKRNQILKILEENPALLVLQIWTDDLSLAQDLAKKVSCGTVWINTFAQMSSFSPFGGTKLSGWGRNLGRFGFFEYIQSKHIGIGLNKGPAEGWF